MEQKIQTVDKTEQKNRRNEIFSVLIRSMPVDKFVDDLDVLAGCVLDGIPLDQGPAKEIRGRFNAILERNLSDDEMRLLVSEEYSDSFKRVKDADYRKRIYTELDNKSEKEGLSVGELFLNLLLKDDVSGMLKLYQCFARQYTKEVMKRSLQETLRLSREFGVEEQIKRNYKFAIGVLKQDGLVVRPAILHCLADQDIQIERKKASRKDGVLFDEAQKIISPYVKTWADGRRKTISDEDTDKLTDMMLVAVEKKYPLSFDYIQGFGDVFFAEETESKVKEKYGVKDLDDRFMTSIEEEQVKGFWHFMKNIFDKSGKQKMESFYRNREKMREKACVQRHERTSRKGEIFQPVLLPEGASKRETVAPPTFTPIVRVDIKEAAKSAVRIIVPAAQREDTPNVNASSLEHI